MLIVGVTGHRSDRLSAGQLPRIRNLIRDGLIVLQQDRPASECRLVSGLADGADQIAAEEALALGWSLEAIIPFAVDDYMRHMPSEEHRRGLAVLISRSGSVEVANGEADIVPHGRHYEKLALALVDRSHVLLAVWDGLATTRVGGTYDVIRCARSKPIPVLWISLDGGGKARLLEQLPQ